MTGAEFVRAFNRLIAPLRSRIYLMLLRGIVRRSDDTGGRQIVQVTTLRDAVNDKRERFQEYGFSSRPIDGAEALVAALSGNVGKSVVICVDDRRYRKKNLKPGEVSLYSAFGQFLLFDENGNLTIGTGQSSIYMTPKSITLTTPQYRAIKAT